MKRITFLVVLATLVLPSNSYAAEKAICTDNIDACIKAAKAGDQIAQYQLGAAYHEGTGLAKNEEKAIEWTKKSAAQGYASAQFNLAESYRFGIGVPKNFEKALELYNLSALQGIKIAKERLGQLVDNECIAETELCEKRANLDDSESQEKLGLMYTNGYGTKKDLAKATEWWKKIADSGGKVTEETLNGWTMLGLAYHEGKDGLAKNNEKAMYWLQKAAEQGEPVAQKVLRILEEHSTSTKTAS